MLNVAMPSPFSPGFTTSFCVCVAVQPHEAFTDLKCTAVFPTFSYLKCATACLSPADGCSSMVFCSHFYSARAATASKIDNDKDRMGGFIFSNRSAQYNRPRRLAKSAVQYRTTPDISP